MLHAHYAHSRHTHTQRACQDQTGVLSPRGGPTMGLDALHPSPHGGCSWKPGAPHKDSRHAIATCSHVLRDAQQLYPWPPTKATGMVGTWGGGGGDEAGSVQAPPQARVPTVFLGPVDQLGIHPLLQLPMGHQGPGAPCPLRGGWKVQNALGGVPPLSSLQTHPCLPGEAPPRPTGWDPSVKAESPEGGVSRKEEFL